MLTPQVPVRLRPSGGADAAQVAAWATSARELRLWCSRPDFPLRPDVVAGWSADPDVRAYLLVGPGGPLAYGEVWHDDGEAELARLIVRPDARGQGLGRRLVGALSARARQDGVAQVFLRVHPDNEVALRCYLGCGFAAVGAGEAAEWNAGQAVAYVWLRLA